MVERISNTESVFQMEPKLKTSTVALKEIGLGLTNAGFENDEGSPDNESPVSLENVKRNIVITLPNNENLRCGNVLTQNEKEQERWGCRHTLALMCFLGLLVSYFNRVNFSIAIVAMVGTRAKNVTFVVPHNHSEGLASAEFNWDEKVQGILLGAFYWGYTATLLVAGRTAEHFGGRLIFGLSLVFSSVLNILTPFCARISTVLLIVVRLLSGAAQGGTIPGLVVLISTWVIPKERSKFTSFIYAGSNLGTVVAMACGGWLSSSSLFGGWPSIFYISGILGLGCGIPWFLLVHDRHETHPRVSQQELNYIAQEKESVRQHMVRSIPWKDIAKSVPFWSIVAANFGYSFGFYTLQSGLPLYFSNILFFDLKENGLLSAFPYAIMTITIFLWGILMDICTQRSIISIKAIRKLSTGVGGYGTVIGLITMCFVGQDTFLALGVLCIAVTLSGTSFCGYPISNQDIAPNLSGTLVGLTNTVGASTGFLAPGIMGLITQGNQTLDAWRLVFIISSAVVFIGTTFYVAFATNQIQPWNAVEYNSASKKQDSQAPGEKSNTLQKY